MALCTTDTKLDQQVRATPYSTASVFGGGGALPPQSELEWHVPLLRPVLALLVDDDGDDASAGGGDVT